jgi:hypothetical protein
MVDEVGVCGRITSVDEAIESMFVVCSMVGLRSWWQGGINQAAFVPSVSFLWSW